MGLGLGLGFGLGLGHRLWFELGLDLGLTLGFGLGLGIHSDSKPSTFHARFLSLSTLQAIVFIIFLGLRPPRPLFLQGF